MQDTRLSPKQTLSADALKPSGDGPMTSAVTAAYDWGQFPVIAEIGGGIGTQLVSILNAFPFSRGLLFAQLPLEAEPIFHDRMESIEGHLFESVPVGADAYLMRMGLYGLAEPEAAAILASVRRAMKPDARLILAELIIPEIAVFDYGTWTDLAMLRRMLKAVGFDLLDVVPTASPLSLMIAKPV